MLDCLGKFCCEYMMDSCADMASIKKTMDDFFKLLGKLADIKDKDVPLDMFFARDPLHPVVCLAMYIYSIERKCPLL